MIKANSWLAKSFGIMCENVCYLSFRAAICQVDVSASRANFRAFNRGTLHLF